MKRWLGLSYLQCEFFSPHEGNPKQDQAEMTLAGRPTAWCKWVPRGRVEHGLYALPELCERQGLLGFGWEFDIVFVCFFLVWTWCIYMYIHNIPPNPAVNHWNRLENPWSCPAPWKYEMVFKYLGVFPQKHMQRIDVTVFHLWFLQMPRQ